MTTDKDQNDALADTVIDIASIQEASAHSSHCCTFPHDIDTRSGRGTLSFTSVLEVKRMFSLQKTRQVQKAKS